MRVLIDDDNDNWLKWGQLIEHWVNHPKEPRPATTSELAQLMKKRGIKGSIPGAARKLEINDYSETGPLYITLPSKQALAADLAVLKGGPYPLPGFYAVAFGGADKVPLNQDETNAFAARRIGEYVVKECC